MIRAYCLPYWGGFGLVFFPTSLPFYFLAYMRLGLEFTKESLFGVVSVSVLSDRHALYMAFESLNSILGSLVFGVTVGLGPLACFRHKGSLCRMELSALVMQDQSGSKVSYTQLLSRARTAALFWAMGDRKNQKKSGAWENSTVVLKNCPQLT